MNQSEVQVVHGPDLHRHGIPTVVGVMPAETLVRHHYVPRRSVLENTGYQRNPSLSRISGLARELKNNEVDLPTSVLLNLRDADAEEVLVKTGPDAYILCLDSERASNEHRLYVVDGQHRILALHKALEDGVSLENKKIPFVCMIGASELQEMEQFHVVNSNAKSVPTDLALELLKARAQQDPEYAALIAVRGRQWEVSAQELTEKLAATSNIWKGRIRLPNMPKGETTVPSASFVRSLRRLLDQPTLFRQIKETERQAQIIDAYWHAARRVLPDAFEKPQSYNIQKGVGVDALHAILPLVLYGVASTGSLFDPESYVPALSPALENLEGRNGEGENVSGVDFWVVGRKGASGGFAGASGKKRLEEYLQSLLPDLGL